MQLRAFLTVIVTRCQINSRLDEGQLENKRTRRQMTDIQVSDMRIQCSGLLFDHSFDSLAARVMWVSTNRSLSLPYSNLIDLQLISEQRKFTMKLWKLKMTPKKAQGHEFLKKTLNPQDLQNFLFMHQNTSGNL